MACHAPNRPVSAGKILVVFSLALAGALLASCTCAALAPIQMERPYKAAALFSLGYPEIDRTIDEGMAALAQGKGDPAELADLFTQRSEAVAEFHDWVGKDLERANYSYCPPAFQERYVAFQTAARAYVAHVTAGPKTADGMNAAEIERHVLGEAAAADQTRAGLFVAALAQFAELKKTAGELGLNTAKWDKNVMDDLNEELGR
jgi:hypothetical protein